MKAPIPFGHPVWCEAQPFSQPGGGPAAKTPRLGDPSAHHVLSSFGHFLALVKSPDRPHALLLGTERPDSQAFTALREKPRRVAKAR